MRRLPGRHMPARSMAIGLALLVHGLLILLWRFGSFSDPRSNEAPVQFISLWPEIELPTTATEVITPPEPGMRALAEVPPPEPATEESASITDPAPQPPIDWQREATEAAKRQAERTGDSTEFSAPPATMRKPCEPPESSFKWNPETPRAGFTRTPIPLPFVRLGDGCVVGLGFFSCILNALPADGRLFDDVKEGKAQVWSVPDPNICD
jgi:hypothetical protein